MLCKEQIEVVESPLRGVSMVYARAGAGKTTALVHKAQRHAALDGARGLYVAFAKAAQMDAEPRFGSAAVCKTGHALSFPRFGRKYAHKLRSMRPFEVISTTGLVDDFGEAKLLVDAIHEWCVSDAMVFPATIRTGDLGRRISPLRAVQLAGLAEQLWVDMCDPSSPVPMPHDGHLKLFQLSMPRLPGDYVMVDEFQDTNPVLLDIIRRQHQPVIAVGDPHQSVFAFRGAVDAMSELKATRELRINQSFRFGPDVAEVANTLLGRLKNEKQAIIGCGPKTDVRWDCTAPQGIKSLTVIARTNGELFEHAVDAIKHDKSLSFVGGVESYGLGKLCDMRHLAHGSNNEVEDAFLRSFQSYWQLQEYADEVEDLELRRLVRISEEYGDRIYDLVALIHQTVRADLDADFVLTTAHRCKGLTRDHVILADDFPALVEDDSLAYDLDPQEVNLAYVALTRASKSLTLNTSLKTFLLWCRRNPPA